MITPSFSLTATEHVLPKLALDFTTASLDSRITFTRALNTATRVNSSGLIETVNADLPRFDYNPITKVCKGLLIEESRKNIKLYSQDLANASAWSATYGTTLASGFTSPDGTTNAVKATNTAGVTSLLQANIAITASATNVYYPTVFVKKGNTSTVTLNVYYNGASEYNGYFNLDTLSVTSIPVAGAYIFEDYGDGWYRIGYQMPVDATGTRTQINYRIWESSRGAGVAGNYQYYFGAQLEIGSFPSSYIPTDATAGGITRNADVAVMTGTNFSNWWTSTTGSATVTVIPKSTSGVNPAFGMDDNTTNNIINLRGNSANPELYIKATTDQAQIDAGTIAAYTTYKLSGAWNTNNCVAAKDGASPVTDTSATIPSVTQARIGSDGTNYANAWLQKIMYWPLRLTNAEVQTFSKG